MMTTDDNHQTTPKTNKYNTIVENVRLWDRNINIITDDEEIIDGVTTILTKSQRHYIWVTNIHINIPTYKTL